MKLPTDFKDSIAERFYDKDINRVGETQVTEADGATKSHHDYITGTFKGNVRLTNFGQIQKEYGLEYQIDIAVTCDTDVMIEPNEVIDYDDIRYTVTDVLPFDSHKLIVGARHREP